MDKKRARAINGADSSSCFMLVLSAVRRGICGAVPYSAKIAKLSGMSPIIHKKRDPATTSLASLALLKMGVKVCGMEEFMLNLQH